MARFWKGRCAMSRPLRIQAPGLIYHVMARGNNKMAIFLDDLDYARFLEILGAVVIRFELEVWVFCVMPNHYHLVLRTRRANLSLAMRDLNGVYAQWWNTRHGHVGHILQGRFKAQIVDASMYLLRLCRYVLLNPVRAQLCARPEEWPWSSYKYLASEPCNWVDVGSLLRALDGVDSEVFRAQLLDYVEPASDPEMSAFIRGDCRVIGSEAFAAQFRRRAQAASREVPARERRVGSASLTEILADAVRQGQGLPGGIRQAHESGLYRLSDIARCAGVSPQTVSRIVHGRRRSGAEQRPTTDLTPGA